MDKEKKLHIRIIDFVKRHILELKDNFCDYRDYAKGGNIEESKASAIKAAANAAVLLIIATIIIFVATWGFNFTHGIWVFLAQPQHSALRVIILGVGLMFVLAIVLEQYQKQDEPPITEKELNLNYRRGGESVYLAAQPINSGLGLKIPSSTSELSTSSDSCCYENGGVWHYTYLLLIDRSSGIDIDVEQIREMYYTRFIQMEAALQLPSSNNPMGYKYKNRYYCSLLAMNAVRSGAYVKLDIALASDLACELFDRRKPIDSMISKVDEDI